MMVLSEDVWVGQRVCYSTSVIFYKLIDSSMFFGDANIALVSCHFKSSAHHDFATHMLCIRTYNFLTNKTEANYGNAYDFKYFCTSG